MAAKTTQLVSVVTGGAGFLGSHLVDRLLAEGHRVIAIDNLITGNTANIGHLAGNENFRFIKHNVSNFIFLPEEKIDYVFHFASPASPIDYLELPIPTLKVGALGTHNTLGLAKDKNASFILASTSEVYGDPLVHPQKEDYWGNVNPIGPRGVYDEAKRFAEALTMAYHRTHGIETRIVRIFNTHGPRMRLNDGRVVPTSSRRRCAASRSPSTAMARRHGASATCPTWWKGSSACCAPTTASRSTAATRWRSRSSSSRSGSRRSPDRRARSSSAPCRRTTPGSASPTSPRRARCSAGSPGSRSRRGSGGRSTSSAPWCARHEDPGDGRSGLHRLARGGHLRRGRPRGDRRRLPLDLSPLEREPQGPLPPARHHRSRARRADPRRAPRGAEPPRGADGRAPLGRRSALRRERQHPRHHQPARGGAQGERPPRPLRVLRRRRLRRAGGVPRARVASHQPRLPLRRQQAGGRALRLLLPGRVPAPLHGAALRQRLRPAPGPARGSGRGRHLHGQDAPRRAGHGER